MPPSERGLYEPSDDVRVFDAAEDEEEEEGSRLPLLIVLALLVLGMFAGVVWVAYKQGEASGRGEPLVITADAGPAKVAPTETQAGQTPNQGLKIYEQPAPADENSDPAQPPATAATAPVQTAAVAPPVEKPAAVETAPPKPAPAVTPPATKPAVTATTPASKPAPVVTATKTPPATIAAPKPVVTATVTPKPVATTIAPKPAPVTATALPPTKPVVAPPATVATTAPKSLAPPTTAPASAAGGGYQLQLGAYASQSVAENEWHKYQTKQGTLLTGYSPIYQAVNPDAPNSLYRLRIGGIDSKDVAVALCERIKANGGNCIVAAR